jgi:hypothetical protein
MASLPKAPARASSVAETVERHFRQLEATWIAETRYSSSYTEKVGHPAFREIISLGQAVVPLMLQDLKEQPRLWVWALPEITGENPVPIEDAGNIARMSEAWLRWGRTHGH